MLKRILIGFIGLVLVLSGFLLWKNRNSDKNSDFPGMNIPSEIRIAYTQTDSSPYSLVEELIFMLSEEDSTYKVSGTVKIVPKNQGAKTETSFVNATVSLETVKSLIETIHKDKWSDISKPAEIIQQVNSYPNRTLNFFIDKREKFSLFSTSNTINGDPWNLRIGENLYAVNDSLTGKEIMNLFSSIRGLEGDYAVKPD